MITVAVSLNIGLALVGFYVAWRLWRLSQTLGAVADALVNWEYHTHNTLNPAVVPPAILLGQRGTARLRGSYARLQRQIHQLQRLLAVAGLLPPAARWLGLGAAPRRWPRAALGRAKKR